MNTAQVIEQELKHLIAEPQKCPYCGHFDTDYNYDTETYYCERCGNES